MTTQLFDSKKTYCLGHWNFGILTSHVPWQNFKTYIDKAEAQRDCDAIHAKNPKMRVLLCTPLGTPCRIANSND